MCPKIHILILTFKDMIYEAVMPTHITDTVI